METAKTFLSALIILVVGAIVISALNVAKINDKDRFSISATGTVYAKADIANINLGVKTESKPTAAEATNESSKKMNNVIVAIKNLGIDEKDIKTENYELRPVYNWTQDKGQELTGYEVNQNLNIKVRDINKAGSVIAKATEMGANQIGNISFTIDDDTKLKDQARDLAIKNAKEKAQAIAIQTGMKLGGIKNMTESKENNFTPNFANAKMNVADSKEQLPEPQIQTGQNEIKVNVTLTYEVK